MSLQHVREAARRHTERNQHNKHIFYIAFAGYIIVSLAQRETGLGLLMVLRVALGALWILYLPRYRPQPISLSLGATDVPPGLQYYRTELTAERDYFRARGKWVTPLLYMTVIFVTSLSMGWTVAIPLSIAFGVFLIWFYLQRKRALPEIEREIQALNSLSL